MNNMELTVLGQECVLNTYSRIPIALVKGEGCKVWDADGKEYIDLVAGIAVNNLGHCHPKVVEAIQKQAKELMHCSNLFWNEPQIQLAQLITDNSCGKQVFFCNSGTEANEGAIKLARKFGSLTGGRYEIITAYQSFHGRTIGSMTATGQTKYQEGFAPLPEGFIYVDFNDIESLLEKITDRTCAIMLEPVQGEGGVNIPNQEYLQQVASLCQRYNLLLILDEVQTGIGRTGKLFGYEHFGVKPDVFTLAKGLGGGFPIGAIVVGEKAVGVLEPGNHASTFGGNPLACSAGIAVLQTILEEKLLSEVVFKGNYFIEKLQIGLKGHPLLKKLRNKGLMIAIELNGNGTEIVSKCQHKGLLINCLKGNILRLVPPLTITKEEIDQAVNILLEVMLEKK